MLLVLPRGVAHDTDRLLVQQAVQLQLLPMKRAHLPPCFLHFLTLLLLSPSLLHTGLTQVLQGQAGHRVVHAVGPAQGTVSFPSLPSPVLLETGSAEAVGALEDHGVPEDVAAYGTGEVLLWQKEPACHTGLSLLFSLESESGAKGVEADQTQEKTTQKHTHRHTPGYSFITACSANSFN